MPEAMLSGVDNGGRTSGGVTLKTRTSKPKPRLYLNGEAFGFAFGDAFTREGSNRTVLIDMAGNATECVFEIMCAGNAVGTAVIIAAHILAAGGLVAVWFMRKRKAFKANLKRQHGHERR